MVTRTIDEKPYLEKKSVVLCRSGIQLYTQSEARRMVEFHNDSPVKDFYRVYRPKSVVVGAMAMMTNLPVVVEHPDVDVTADNWNNLAKGYTGSELEVIQLDDGEIGVKSCIIFPTHDLFNYYQDGNDEVSLGYKARYMWAVQPDTVGYDIIMFEIDSVNHLALTAGGRGGPQVSVIDSLIGGLRKMKTGLFAKLLGLGNTKDGKKTSFSEKLFSAIEKSKGLEGDALAAVVSSVTDSVAILKDSPKKELLLGYVQDSFSLPEMALKNKEPLAKVVDSTYDEAVKETMDEDTMDEDGRGTGTKNVQDAEGTEDAEAAKAAAAKKKEEEEAEEKKKSSTTDSAVTAAIAALKAELPAIIRDTLGIKEDGEGGEGGSTADSSIESLALQAVDVNKYLG